MLHSLLQRMRAAQALQQAGAPETSLYEQPRA
jgi:hypothetical protein